MPRMIDNILDIYVKNKNSSLDELFPDIYLSANDIQKDFNADDNMHN